MLHKSIIEKNKKLWKYYTVDYIYIYIVIIIKKVWLLIIMQICKQYDCCKKMEKL